MRHLRTRSQFQALLRQRPVARTAHFALHWLPVHRMAAPQWPAGVGGAWLGAVVPKRCAKRAVRRNLVRRQIYAVGAGALQGQQQGAWLVRLRSAFPRQQYPSAGSDALARAVRAELLELFEWAPSCNAP